MYRGQLFIKAVACQSFSSFGSWRGTWNHFEFFKFIRVFSDFCLLLSCLRFLSSYYNCFRSTPGAVSFSRFFFYFWKIIFREMGCKLFFENWFSNSRNHRLPSLSFLNTYLLCNLKAPISREIPHPFELFLKERISIAKLSLQIRTVGWQSNTSPIGAVNSDTCFSRSHVK